MDAFAAGAAFAAQALRYHGLAELIEVEGLGPERVATLFGYSASTYRGTFAALILITGGIARYRADPKGWDGEPERRLAYAALKRQGIQLIDKRLAELSSLGARLLARETSVIPTWMIGRPRA